MAPWADDAAPIERTSIAPRPTETSPWTPEPTQIARVARPAPRPHAPVQQKANAAPGSSTRPAAPPPPPTNAAFDPESPAPALRDDLVIVARDNGKVLVKRPESPTAFPIYMNEWTIAQLLDGERSYAGVATGATRLGVSATPALIAKFVRELNGYGFLSTVRAPTRNRSPLRAGLEVAKSDEERNLIMAALEVDDGTPDSAVAEYLDAILQVNPDNDDVKTAIAEYRSRQHIQSESAHTYVGPPLMADDQRRGTRRLPDSDVGPEGERQLAPPVRGSRRVALALLAVTLLVFGGVLGYVVWSNRRLQAQLAELQAPVTPEVVAQNRRPAVAPAPAAILAHLSFRPAKRELVRPAQPGVWAESLVEEGAQVSPGDLLGTTMTAQHYATYARALRRYNHVRQNARDDDVYRYFLSQARADFEAATRALSRTRIVASQAGFLEKLRVKPGTSVTAETVIAELVSRDRLEAALDSALLPFPVGEATCRVESALGCAVIIDSGGRMTIQLDDPEHKIPDGQPTTVSITRRSPL